MNKRIGTYGISLAILLVLFNVIAFVSPGWIGAEKYTASFWTGYVVTTLSFAGEFACAWFALKEENVQKLFYNISLLTTSYSGLIAIFVVGVLCMLIPFLPVWVAILACAIVLALNALSVVKVTGAIQEVERIDEAVKVKTFFIKSITVDAQTLMASAKSEAVKAQCKKVYEALRYSDPMSSSALADDESRISALFGVFSDAVTADDAEAAAQKAGELLIRIEARNRKCKLLK